MSLLLPILLGIDDVGGGIGTAPSVVASVTVTPGAVSLQAGTFAELTARYYDGEGQELSGLTVVWASSDTQVATISAAGVLVAHEAGSVTISATVGSVTTTIAATVTATGAVTPVLPTGPTIFDPADLVRRCRRLAGRPDTDAATNDEDWYAYLTEAELHYVSQLAVHCPEALYGPPELMTTTDDGLTYQVAHYPLGRMEIRESPAGRLLRPSAEWSENDFVPEGQRIRFPSSRRRAFHNGPWARYVRAPQAITAELGSQLPVLARRILVYHAVVLWATRGSYRNPGPFEVMERKAWSGDPNVPGDVGILGALKTQYFGAGLVARPAGGTEWYHSPDLG